MAKKAFRRGARPVGDMICSLIDPVLQKRAGISLALLQSWQEIAGERIAANSRPEKITWPKRYNENDSFQPGSLVVACEGFAAIALQHDSAQVIARVNGFLGFNAVSRLKIVQKPILTYKRPERPAMRVLQGDEEERLQQSLDEVSDEKLRASLERLGRNIIAARD